MRWSPWVSPTATDVDPHQGSEGGTGIGDGRPGAGLSRHVGRCASTCHAWVSNCHASRGWGRPVQASVLGSHGGRGRKITLTLTLSLQRERGFNAVLTLSRFRLKFEWAWCRKIFLTLSGFRLGRPQSPFEGEGTWILLTVTESAGSRTARDRRSSRRRTGSRRPRRFHLLMPLRDSAAR